MLFFENLQKMDISIDVRLHISRSSIRKVFPDRMELWYDFGGAEEKEEENGEIDYYDVYVLWQQKKVLE